MSSTFISILLCTNEHSTTENGSDSLHRYLPGNHHCSDLVYWKKGGLEAYHKYDIK